ncbi:MAG: TraM recognition domain-containing protein [Elusimicrobiota bacterium]|jgi:hypothetical protein
MSPILFLSISAVAVAGFFLLARDCRKSGATLLGICLAVSLTFMPLSALEQAVHAGRPGQRLSKPQAAALRRAWLCFSGGFGFLTGILLAFAKLAGKRNAGWDQPGNMKDLDPALAACLASAGKDTGTFIGMAAPSRKVLLDARSREAHMQVVGPTRSGKSQFLFSLAGQDMRRGMPVFFMEAKGDRSDFDQFLTLAKLCGREADVRYFNPQDSRSMSFNPIRALPGQDATALANQIARVIGREPTSSGEGQDYYRSVDYSKIQNMAEVFWNTGLEFTLRDCFLYFAHEECRERAFQLCKDPAVVDAAMHEFEQSPDTTALTSAIRPWTTGPLGKLLNTYAPRIRLEEIFAKNQLAYFAIPIGHLQVMANPLGRMLISALLSIAAWRQQSLEKPGPAAVILDEFSEFATPAFASFIATVGSAKFWTTLSHQDLGQLKKVQGMDVDAFHSAVFNNTSGCKICFRTPDPEDAEFWSSILGTYTTFEDTERVESGILGARRTGQMSRRGVDHFKIHPNKLKNLAPGTALVFAPGQQDCLVRTARVYPLIKEAPPRLPDVEAPVHEGLDLASALRPGQQGREYVKSGVRSS